MPKNVLDATTEEQEIVEEELPEEEHGSELDPEVLNQMLMTGENQEGMFEPDEQEMLEEGEELHEEPDQELLFKQVKEKLGAHSGALVKDMKDNPDKFMIETPRGTMSIFEAIAQGYDPYTKDFTDTPLSDEIDQHFGEAGLSEQDMMGMQQMMDPAQMQLAPVDAQAMGVPEGSPMIAPQQGMVPPMDPNQGGMF